MDNVVGVMPTLIKLNSCSTNLDLVSIHGVDVDSLRSFRDLDIQEGSFESFAGESSAALIGQELMRRRGWKIGDGVDINGINFTIRGTFTNDGSTYESLALVHIEFLQQATGIGRGSHATQLYVKVNDGKAAETVAQRIDEQFSTDIYPTDTKPESTFLAKGLSEFREIVNFSQLLGYIAAILILVLVANTIYMATQDRVQEIAVLRTIGFSEERVMVVVVLESLLLSAVGGAIGTAAAYLVISQNNFGIGIEGYQVAFAAHHMVFGICIAASLILGLVGGTLPAVSAARMKIVDGLRKV